jgi:hypothetical protein
LFAIQSAISSNTVATTVDGSSWVNRTNVKTEIEAITGTGGTMGGFCAYPGGWLFNYLRYDFGAGASRSYLVLCDASFTVQSVREITFADGTATPYYVNGNVVIDIWRLSTSTGYVSTDLGQNWSTITRPVTWRGTPGLFDHSEDDSILAYTGFQNPNYIWCTSTDGINWTSNPAPPTSGSPSVSNNPLQFGYNGSEFLMYTGTNSRMDFYRGVTSFTLDETVTGYGIHGSENLLWGGGRWWAVARAISSSTTTYVFHKTDTGTFVTPPDSMGSATPLLMYGGGILLFIAGSNSQRLGTGI